jgi:hypothetical protein
MKAKIFSGVIPALMTPCKDDRSPDFDALAPWVTGRCSPTSSAWKASSAS